MRYFTIVTNRKGDGLTLICSNQEKTDTVELVHHVQKNKLVAAVLLSGEFGANAASTCSPTICSAR